uniref:Receptor kinase-like protein Xa21 n=2 Tax=Oryza punctata TaxID=4537 RepID=A0A0E0JE20_ORYPU
MAIRRMRIALSLCVLMTTIGTASGGASAAMSRRCFALKAGLSGSSSSALASWNTSTSFCGWEGVTCSRRWPMRVVALNLPSSNITGMLSPGHREPPFLRRLNLSSNQLHGEIPLTVGRLRRLLILDMDHNSSGAFPANLSSCISLTILLIQYNLQLGGCIPPELGNTLPRLQRLQLRKNSLTGEIPASLANLSSLQHLSLSYNNLEDLIPPGLGDIAGLRYLFLNANNLSGKLPLSLYNLSSLTMLQVGNNMLHGSIPSDIGRMLPDLYLSDNKFTRFVPPNLGRLQSLQYLYLVGNQLEADNTKGWEFLTSLSNCSQLQEFLLANNSFSGQLPRSIGNLSATLQMLNLENNSISGSIPEDIGNLVGLSFLDLGFNSKLSGVIPESIGKLTNLVEISLYNTSLSGLILASIGNLTSLNRIYAFYCNLEGQLPPEFGSLVNLNGMDLSGNQLSGQIPDSIGNCEVIEALYLEENSFEGVIPQSLSNLKGLTILNLTMNNLSGRIPDTIARIPNLQQFTQQFSGPIPATLQNLTTLRQLDVSFNKLQGEASVKGVFRNLNFASIVGNNLCGGIPQLHLAPCPILNASKNRNQHLKSLAIALPTTGAILVLVSAIVVIMLHHRKFKRRQNRQATPLVIEEQYQRVSYYALSRGSNEFSEANLLGKEDYGSVFRCTLDDESALVAVEVFDLQQSGSSKSFEAECEALRRVRHRCLIKIITCCSSIGPQGQEFKALVFEFMPNGSLDGWIHPKSSNLTPSNTLSLSQRLNIAVVIFDALDYLHNHCQPPILHCDLKHSNILLPEDKSAKVGDFGISRILPTTKTLQSSKSSIGIRGSIGYIAPEYGEGSTVTRAGDTYSLGILLLEMFTGRSPTDDIFRDSMDMHKFVAASFLHQPLDIADPTIWLHEEENDSDVKNESIKTRIIQQCLVSVLRLGISCSKQQLRERMMLAEAVSEMHATINEYLRSWMVDREEHGTVS